MSLPAWLSVVPRAFPSSTLVVVAGPRPVVVDPGSATDADQLPELLAGARVRPDAATTVVCTHFHADHVGAAAALQADGARVAAHAWDAAMVNARDPQVCASRWLDQPVLPYRVDRALQDGDVIDTGEVSLRVLHTPGHTLGGISLWEPESRTLIGGDAVHADDTPWIGTAHEGAGSLQRARLSLDRIERLDPARIVSGHGPLITDAADAIDRTRRRFATWAADPRAGALHAAKRIFVYRLMLEPIPEADVARYLRDARWLRDLAFSTDDDVDDFADRILGSLSHVVTRDGGLLRTTAPHRTGPDPVPWHHVDPRSWPAVGADAGE